MKKMKAKIIAQDLIMDALAVVRGYWREQEEQLYGKIYNEEEFLLIQEQVIKAADKIAKSYGFEKSWGY